MRQNLKKILDLLSPAERRRSYLLLAMIAVMALLEAVGVASIMPFMSLLADPEAVVTNPYLAAVHAQLGFSDSNRFLFFLGLVVFVALMTSVSFKAVTTYALLRFTHMREYSLSKRLVAGYLRQPYEWFLSRHGADLGKTVLSEVDQVIRGTLIPVMQAIANGAVVIALLILLVVADPLLALLVSLSLGGTYAAIYIMLRRYLARIGVDRVESNRERFEAVQEAFGGIKDVKVAGLEGAMLKRFDGPAKRFAQHKATSEVAGQLPRFVLQIIAFGGVLAIVLYLLAARGSLEEALPVIGLYALAGYRLLPSLQAVYQQLSKMRFSGAAIDSLHKDLQQLDATAYLPLAKGQLPLGLWNEIRLENVRYAYPTAERAALEGLTLQIPARTTVGFVGATGSGKTTTVDIILGLLVPQQGRLVVDGQMIDATNVRAWQRTIGYVPQHIYLADDTVAANIAFGIPADQIDMAAVERAARIANLHRFVTEEMPKGYATRVGERGVRLSGGQRQRIGIARALYHDPEVLIMDEATSALDNLTEQAVMEAVHNLANRKTIIMIAHRLTTVRNCDCIFMLERGRLVAQGRYDELVETSASFRAMTANQN